jgi:hypothetical protein
MAASGLGPGHLVHGRMRSRIIRYRLPARTGPNNEERFYNVPPFGMVSFPIRGRKIRLLFGPSKPLMIRI